MSSRSWGHSVRRLTEDELTRLREHAAYAERAGFTHPQWDTECHAHHSCHAPATHRIHYRYITGRQGRESRAEKNVCSVHADRFATQWMLEVPTT